MNSALTKKVIINDNIIWRYESKIKNGTIFIYNIKTSKIYEGNTSLYLIIKNINGENDLGEIKELILNDNPKLNEEKLNESLTKAFEFLFEKGIISYKE